MATTILLQRAPNLTASAAAKWCATQLKVAAARVPYLRQSITPLRSVLERSPKLQCSDGHAHRLHFATIRNPTCRDLQSQLGAVATASPPRNAMVRRARENRRIEDILLFKQICDNTDVYSEQDSTYSGERQATDGRVDGTHSSDWLLPLPPIHSTSAYNEVRQISA